MTDKTWKRYNREQLLADVAELYYEEQLTQEQMDSIIIDESSKLFRAAVFGVFIILTVFIPIMTLTGIEGKMFRPMAMTFTERYPEVDGALTFGIRNLLVHRQSPFQNIKVVESTAFGRVNSTDLRRNMNWPLSMPRPTNSSATRSISW